MYPTQFGGRHRRLCLSASSFLNIRALSLGVRYGRRVTSDYEPKVGRIPIRLISPRQPTDLWPAKAVVGEVVPFRAIVFMDGHDVLGTELLLTDPSGVQTAHRMQPGPKGSDSWEVPVQLSEQGLWQFSVRGWSDEWASWLAVAKIKVPAGVDTKLTLDTGAVLLRRALVSQPESVAMAAALERVTDPALSPEQRLAAATLDAVRAEFERHPLFSLETLSLPLPLMVERTRAGVGAWYEFFPRSEGAKAAKNGSWVSGNFRTAAKRLKNAVGERIEKV